jgi:hypothetical protein
MPKARHQKNASANPPQLAPQEMQQLTPQEIKATAERIWNERPLASALRMVSWVTKREMERNQGGYVLRKVWLCECGDEVMRAVCPRCGVEEDDIDRGPAAAKEREDAENTNDGR